MHYNANEIFKKKKFFSCWDVLFFPFSEGRLFLFPHQIVMRHVSDVPAEIWTLIFEYLNLEDLAEAESACKSFWGRITHRIAASVINDIIAYSKPAPYASIDCPNLPAKAQIQRIRNGLKPRPSFFDTCRPLQYWSYSHAFQRKENTTQLTLQLESPFCRDPQLGDPQDFHSCENGPEPIEIIDFIAEFTFPPPSRWS